LASSRFANLAFGAYPQIPKRGQCPTVKVEERSDLEIFSGSLLVPKKLNACTKNKENYSGEVVPKARSGITTISRNFKAKAAA